MSLAICKLSFDIEQNTDGVFSSARWRFDVRYTEGH